MTDLDKLIEAVVLAALPEPIFHGSSSVRGHWAYTTGLDAGQRRSVFMAYNGSLDAANALHDALLPGWTRDVDATAPECGITVTLHNVTSFDDSKVISADMPCEARAWLIAILKAYRSKVQE